MERIRKRIENLVQQYREDGSRDPMYEALCKVRSEFGDLDIDAYLLAVTSRLMKQATEYAS